MAASFVTRLDPRAEPYNPMELVAAQFCAPTPSVLPHADFIAPQCFYPPPPPPTTPPVTGWPVACGGGFRYSNGGFPLSSVLLSREAAPAFPLPPAEAWLHPPPTGPVAVYYCQSPAPAPTPSATRCRITEIGEDGGEVGDEPSPRSVLTVWSRKLPTTLPSPPRRARAALPPPPPRPSFGAKARRRWPRLAFDPNTNITSLMIRNIPNKFMKRRFIAILDQFCVEENSKLAGSDGVGAAVKAEYDFLYVPIDFSTKSNKGYAFVNMTTPAAARRLHAHLHGHRWEAAASSRKVCDVVHARIEGLDALVAHFAASRFPCGDEEFLPVRFEPPRDGVRPTAEHVVGRRLRAGERL